MRFGTRVFSALMAVAMFSFPGSAQTQEDKTLSPYFFVQGEPGVDRLPLKDTRVQIDVSGVIADVKVRQTYRNEGPRAINARYVFPASTRAAVYAMRMRVGDQVVAAKIKEREKAKQEFDRARQEVKSASLLEQNRPNVFSMSLANVMPGDQVEIELSYIELLVPTDGVYEVVFPTVAGAMRLIEQQRGGGGTELLAAVKRALSLPRKANASRSVVLVTDGYVSAEKGVFDYIRDHLNQCNVFSFGIGTAVNRHLVEGVAKAGMGEPFIVTQEAEAHAVAARFREYIQTPLLTDIRISASGFDVYDVHPARPPRPVRRAPSDSLRQVARAGRRDV